MKRIYRHLQVPEHYPLFTRRAAKAVTRDALENTIQFTSIRSFHISEDLPEGAAALSDDGAHPLPEEGSRLVEMEETIDMFVDYFGLGKVIWPVYPTLFADNIEELARLCKERGLYIYDLWGFVPGSHPVKGIWGEYTIPEKADKAFRELLGDHFLGYDNGEQDGRYIHSGAGRQAPMPMDRKAQYKAFQAYFEKLNDSMNNNTVTLSSLTFLPYFAKEGNTIMLGAETAQALPSSVMWFSFIRGASRQYGLLYYGNASVWNRWGYKDYNFEETDTSMGYEAGRFAGTSLSLLRRLLYNQYMYNCDILGFEGGWFATKKAEEGDVSNDSQYIMGGKKYLFTPIGTVQKYGAEFVKAHGTPGVLYTPMAIVADFHSGWVPPRQLYSKDIYKVWGNLPYNDGDHQLDCLFTLMYPGYERAGFFRDESGFATPTPYGEIADVLMSDAAPEILARYSAAVLLNETDLTLELFRNLENFVSRGGRLVTFAGEAERARALAALAPEAAAFFGLDTGAEITVWGKGTVTVIPEANGLVSTGVAPVYTNEPNGDIPRVYRFSDKAFSVLDGMMKDLRVIYPDNAALQYCLDADEGNAYTIFVANNTHSTETFSLIAAEGSILTEEVWPIEDGVTNLPEFLPLGFPDTHTPTHEGGKYELAAGDCMIIRVTADGIEREELPETNPEAHKADLYLAFRGNESAKDFLLNHPTFNRHFEGLMLPATYFEAMSEERAAREGHYFKLQNVPIMVDFAPIINHYPDLSIIGNFPDRTTEARARVERTMRLASLYGCTGAVFTCTRNAENEWSMEDARIGTVENLKVFGEITRKYNAVPYLMNRPLEGCFTAAEQYAIAREADLEPAVNSALLDCAGKEENVAPSAALNPSFHGFTESTGHGDSLPEPALLCTASCERDMFGQAYKVCRPAFRGNGAEKEAFRAAAKRGVPTVLYADFASWDEVTAELEYLFND